MQLRKSYYAQIRDYLIKLHKLLFPSSGTTKSINQRIYSPSNSLILALWLTHSSFSNYPVLEKFQVAELLRLLKQIFMMVLKPTQLLTKTLTRPSSVEKLKRKEKLNSQKRRNSMPKSKRPTESVLKPIKRPVPKTQRKRNNKKWTGTSGMTSKLKREPSRKLVKRTEST